MFVPVSAPLPAPRCVFSSFSGGIGVENANLFHKAITSHHDIEPTSLQCPPMLAVKMSDESFSSGGNPIWFTLLFFLSWRGLFAQGRVSFEYQSLWGGGQTFWIQFFFKECDYLRVIDEGIWSLNNAHSVKAGWWSALSDSWRRDEHCSTFASHCAFLLGCSVQMAFEKLFTFLALNPNNVEHAPDTSEAYSCLLSCIHSINERHTRVTVGVWHLLAQCLGICYKTYLSCLSHLCLSVQLLLPFKWASINQSGIKS